MKKSPITAVILTHNSCPSLERCLSSVSFCDEIVVVDDVSHDKTAAIARQHSAKVYMKALEGDFAEQRNFAMRKASNEWLLYIDSDEQIDEPLKESIIEAVEQGNHDAYYLRRRDYWWGRELKYGEVMKVRSQGLIRLMKKNSGTWTGRVHETFEATGATARLDGYINHFPHQSLREFIHEINTYSTLRATELHDKQVKANLFHVLAYPLGKFIVTYILRLGFLDGAPGFAYAFLMSFHSYLVRVKLYQYRMFGKP